jgi:hypothetical protein
LLYRTVFPPFSFISAIASAAVLSSCSGATPSSPTADNAEPDFVSRAQPGIVILELHQSSKLLKDGSVIVRLRAVCPPGFNVIEGPLTLMQGPEFQEIFGEGFFTNRCDGHWHLQKVRVRAPEEFQRGTARVSATLMVEHPTTGEFLQGDANGVVNIH